MDLFDQFKRKKKEVSKTSSQNESSKEKLERKKADLNSGMSIRNGVLKHVYENAIINGTFTVPKEVKQIDMFALSNKTSLKTVIMHDNIKYIALGAFQDCVNLTDVKGLEHANKLNMINGFSGCKKLKNIKLPPSVECVEFEAFLECESLPEINLSENCWNVSSRAFAGCKSLDTVQLPAGIELIDAEAFAGCTNATIVFMEDDKNLISDMLKEQKEMDLEFQREEFNFDSDNHEMEPLQMEEEMPQPSMEEMAQYYDDMNIRYRIIDIGGEKFLWPSKPVEILPDAFIGVKEVVSADASKLDKVSKSGYKGKISIVYPETNQMVSIDLSTIEQLNNINKAQKREKYYSQFLIPAGATTSWLVNCEKNNYRTQGYAGTVIWETPIFNDATISVIDYTQPKSESYRYFSEDEEFFTCVTFTKKELDNRSIYAPYEYDRAYSFYYPFGARFDTQILTEVATSLSILIDTARELQDNKWNATQLALIEQKQKQIIELFFNGTTDKNAISNIMSDKNLYLTSPAKKPKPANSQKDWLPYFNGKYFNEKEELEKLREQKKSKNKQHEIEKD